MYPPAIATAVVAVMPLTYGYCRACDFTDDVERTESHDFGTYPIPDIAFVQLLGNGHFKLTCRLSLGFDFTDQRHGDVAGAVDAERARKLLLAEYGDANLVTGTQLVFAHRGGLRFQRGTAAGI